ncbi:TetR/AcrR family transcriptional regulator [Kitasatospora cheerisanensis]|uniref:Putative TetR family transcriptional regulator n=1 Tax=Kitasatospora cheerisanensis KCTC 2395 TaxID=1348663 RepID=A0A066YYA8_9ACTN|nr:TetR/AcrR family transcriptional regulator [Kitasatospora cheerisanensis]KDN86172.1 putative TetR family transcriptional regulator [Kitasatospora cheerisanensis KCTC 2395]
MAPPRTRRPARPREEVYAAARAAIAEHGLARLTMAGLGQQLGMSAGHLLYYFGSKDQLLLETLRWSETQLGERRTRELARRELPVLERLARYLDLYLPEGPGDPRWILWIEVWSRSPGTAELRQGQLDIETPWQDDLTALITEGLDTGVLTPVAGAPPPTAPPNSAPCWTAWPSRSPSASPPPAARRPPRTPPRPPTPCSAPCRKPDA